MSKKLMIKGIVGLALLLPILSVSAHHAGNHSYFGNKDAALYYTYEANGDDYIYGVGISLTYTDPETDLGFVVTTSLNDATVTAFDGIEENYAAWEAGLKFGIFSNISLYGEVGIDLSELLFHDLRYHYNDCFRCGGYYDEYHDDIDAYVGFGAGVNVGPFKVEGFTRYREIDSRYWEARSEQFSGFQVSINF
ncbi:hypothetical protein FLL45_08815 [Aliikangiella marina]|uniref:Porin family protein n=1 Tax=Aliikangiella marina TaxID=1712262 RepID=A0A545TCT0_9GAMM|nr:hypothetical protein [Aliikangiella marina]TQV75032.1 hypothetical protein FLL45_08815 [Aliikangiella marina]